MGIFAAGAAFVHRTIAQRSHLAPPAAKMTGRPRGTGQHAPGQGPNHPLGAHAATKFEKMQAAIDSSWSPRSCLHTAGRDEPGDLVGLRSSRPPGRSRACRSRSRPRLAMNARTGLGHWDLAREGGRTCRSPSRPTKRCSALKEAMRCLTSLLSGPETRHDGECEADVLQPGFHCRGQYAGHEIDLPLPGDVSGQKPVPHSPTYPAW